MTSKRNIRHRIRRAWPCVALTLALTASLIHAAPPKGVMLNLDLQSIKEGLIPNKTLYPLYVPLCDIETSTSFDRTVLLFKDGQGLDIPHSALLDPDGSDWVVGIRVFAMTDGMIMSQSDGEKGYAIYMKDGSIQAAIQTGHSTLFLKEDPAKSTTECLNKWITVELIIKTDVIILSLNRVHVALLPMQEPLDGSHYRIRIGAHKHLPALLSRSKAIGPEGFTGAVSSLKILRQ